MHRKTVNAWCVYDFGNSAFAVLFPMLYGSYYAETVVGGTRGTKLWGFAVALSMAAVAFSSPLLGGVADHAGRRKRILAVYTALGIVAGFGFAGVEPGLVVLGFVLALVANFAFEGGVVFYNAYLPDIAPPERQGRVSARGFGIGYVGSALALILAMLVGACEWWIGWIWMALGAQWAAAATYSLWHLPPDQPTGVGFVDAALRGVRQTKTTLKEVLRRRNLKFFLLAYFFYMDGVNTVIVMAGVYATQEVGIGLKELALIYLFLQVAAVIGSLLIGKPTDTRGPRWAVTVLLFWWILVVALAFVAPGKAFFWVVAMLAGLGIGGIQSASRALMARLIPQGREAEFFGYYAFCCKTGAIIGPVLFGLVTEAFDSARPAILTVAVFYVVGFLILRKVKEQVD
jgi:UMF1 family MFS transporter